MKKIIFSLPKYKERFFLIRLGVFLGFWGGLAGAVFVAAVVAYFSTQVPDYRALAEYNPQLVTKVYGADGEVLAEYAKQRRIYVPISEIPQDLVNAFLGAEDSDFYNHGGFDILGILRAAFVNVVKGRKQGASTITQQVAKNFLLTSERTYSRKIKELILARRIEEAFTKEQILELYLNHIYFGGGAYGVAAAAITYFNKDLKDLTLSQRAMLGGLPKAPNRFNPIRNPQLARYRRDVVLNLMANAGFITQEQADATKLEDLETNPNYLKDGENAPHFSEHVRRKIQDEYGSDALYEGGYTIFTTLNPKLQSYAQKAVFNGVREYDRRHGFRGPISHMNLLIGWKKRVDEENEKWEAYRDIAEVAVVLEVDDASETAVIGVKEDISATIPLKAMKWAIKYETVDQQGPPPSKPSDILKQGDIIAVQHASKVSDVKWEPHEKEEGSPFYALEQFPKVQAALVALDVQTGAVRALVGGIGSGGGFNRATQAKRQSGSSFKPFVYSLALENGYTPASTILDAPVVLRTGELDEKWKPHNYSEKVYGPSTLRRGLEKSRNLMTIRLARDLGIGRIIRYARKFGLNSPMQRDLSTALGSASLSLLELTGAYGVFANGGRKVEPYFIETVQDAAGVPVYQAHPTCFECTGGEKNALTMPPDVQMDGEQIVPRAVAYQVVDLLKGVVQHGTAWRAKAVGRPVGAKTGTTNDYLDAWLMGFSPTLAIGVWVGFDQPQNLGMHETGSKAAAPIWAEFATNALRDVNATFAIPEGLSFVKVDAKTGLLPTAQTKQKILEVFVEGTEPTSTSGNGATRNPAQQEVEDIFRGIY